jgi:O-antigen ligase
MRGRVRFIFGAIVAAIAVYAAVTYIPPLHERFYHGQIVQVQTGVPGVAQFNVNLEGRLELWTTTWDSYLTSPLIGHGAGASDDLITRTYGSSAGHPHDDYLRLLNDYGAIGLALWAVAYFACLQTTFRYWVRSVRIGSSEAAVYHLSASLALIAVGAGMITDNVMIYLPIMLPVGALVGLSLLLGSEGFLLSDQSYAETRPANQPMETSRVARLQ